MAERAPGVHTDGGPAGNPRKDPRGYLDACAERYGPAFTLTAQQTHVRCPVTGRQVLREESAFALAPALVTTDRSSIQVDRPERWRLARKVIRDHLSESNCEAATPDLVERWQRELAGRTSLDLDQVIDMTARVQWPLLLRDTASPKLFDLLLATSRARQNAMGGLSWLGRRRLARQFDDIIASLLSLTNERREQQSSTDRPDLLDALIAPSASELTDLDVAQTLAICLDSAMMTTGSAAAWTMVAIGTSPGAAGHAIEDFVAEVLRHYPVIEALNRTSTGESDLAGHRVALHDTVLVEAAAMHRDPQWWRDDPRHFSPARWTGGQTTHDRGAYLPFGAGPRFCLGSRAALATLVTLVTTLSAYDLHLGHTPVVRRDNLNWPDPFTVTLSPRVE